MVPLQLIQPLGLALPRSRAHPNLGLVAWPSHPEPQAARPVSGMKLIEGLAHQIEATPVWSSAEPGTLLYLKFDSHA